VQGFIAKVDGRPMQFLDRVKAAEHALFEFQVKRGKANIYHKFNGTELYSEDLW